MQVANNSKLKIPSRTRLLNIKKIIIDLSGYTLVGETQRDQATNKAKQLVMIFGKPKIIFKTKSQRDGYILESVYYFESWEFHHNPPFDYKQDRALMPLFFVV